MCFLNVNALHHYWWSTGVPAGALCVECNFIAIGVRSPLQLESSQVKSLAKSAGTVSATLVTPEPSAENECLPNIYGNINCINIFELRYTDLEKIDA